MYTQAETESFHRQFFDDWHAFDVSRFERHFTKDIIFKVGNEAEIRGLKALEQHFAGVYALLVRESHKHFRIDTVRDGTCIYNACEVSIVTKSRPEETVTLPALVYFVRVPPGEAEAGKIKEMTVYQDLGPLKAIIMSASA
ncbi:uncharacterized protein LY89DRAFT_225848 [Mollisia scopiformis]|uniref:SnoaL-like domain-containing protein n=1 Tax=Mollisia scopiformis TaxID=149040 RepID=A0A194WUW0_MOLSC|nr:uncharacterized protein LY89DRAFT_225848 [Mollisia scopiformis]KUJ11449.1 hypothetical protein LY89DRAFT_225848 [Mollisia scopiformis]